MVGVPVRRGVRRIPGAGVEGPARCGRLTKRLARELRAGEIAVTAHRDLDAVTAEALVRARPAAVVNAGRLVTGRVPVQGARLLLQAGVPVLDRVDPTLLDRLAPGQRVRLQRDLLLDEAGRVLARGVRLDAREVERRLRQAQKRLPGLARRFVHNTVGYMCREGSLLAQALPLPSLATPVEGRPAVVVARGPGASRDLGALRDFILARRPVLVAVDGGADVLLDAGLTPDLLVGDMDSCSDRALLESREVVVHAYPDGAAPGLRRVRSLGRFAHVMPSVGTSEDAAVLLVHGAGARPVVAVGAHVGWLEFVERGRAGMASTLLVRMRVGHDLIDARGVAELWPSRPGWRGFASVMAAAASCLAALAVASDPLRLVVRLLWVRLQAGLWLGGVP